jgi:GGDEF domain-containing protein
VALGKDETPRQLLQAVLGAVFRNLRWVLGIFLGEAGHVVGSYHNLLRVSTGMIIDGVLGSEAIDSSGEVLDVAGADISDVDKGSCLLNWEHQPGDKSAATTVGVVLKAKKIFKRDDCETDRQRKYWDEVKMPYIYGVCRLYDGAGHEEAKRIAAIIRDHAANNEPIVCRYSVEGATLKKEDNRLLESVVRRVAVTVKPCNRTAVSGLIEDPNAPDGFEKKPVKAKVVKDLLDFTQAEKSEIDQVQRLGGSWGHVGDPMVKADTAGVPSAAPSALEGGAALQREDLGPKKPKKGKKWTVKQVVKEAADNGYMDQFNRTQFRGFAKTLMPEASDEFLDHFTDVIEDYHVKRGMLAKKEVTAEAPKPKTAKPAEPKAAKPGSPKPKAAPPAAVKPAKVKAAPVEEPDDNPVKLSVATIRGVPVVAPKVKTNKWDFDEKRGILHTRHGSFPMYNPDKGFEMKTHKLAKLSPFYSDGVLHAAPGADVSAYHNGPNPEFAKDLESPDVKEFINGQVLPGFLRNKKNLEAGTLPKDIIHIAYLMSAMSPNTPVSNQQLMQGHAMETWEESGISPDDPEFGKLRKNWKKRDRKDNLPKRDTDLYAADPGTFLTTDSLKSRRKTGDTASFMLADNKWDNIAQYHKLFPTLQGLLQKHGTDSREATDELMAHKVKEMQWKAQKRSFMNKVRTSAIAAGLKDDHRNYVEAKMAEAHAAGKFQKKGQKAPEREPGADDDDESPLPFDPRMLASGDPDFNPDEFMEHPSIAKWSPSRLTGRRWYRAQFKQEATDAGLQDNLTPFINKQVREKFPKFEGTAVPGLAPKTGRYAFLLCGASNAAVHDTHYIRHMLGMDAGKDGRTLLKLKTGLWRPQNHHILKKMDKWYAENHPAPKAILNDPEMGHHFKDVHDAVGPAFWMHWAVIPRDEGRRGLDASQSQNELATHSAMFRQMDRVYGETAPRLKKAEGFEKEIDHHNMGKLVALFLQYQNEFGEIPAMMMYYKHIVPHLYEMAEYREKHDDLSDFVKSITTVDRLGIELRKSAHDIQVAKLADPNRPTVHSVFFKDHQHGNTEHLAGRFALYQGQVHHLEDYHGLLAATLPEGPLTVSGVAKVHGLKMSPHVRIATTEIGGDDPKFRDHAQPEKMQNRARLPRPPSVFAYHRAGHDKPHTLEVKDGHYLLDGEKLSQPEVQKILENHRTGAASIKYLPAAKKQFESIQKAEEAFASLMKADPEMHPHELLQYIRDAEARGHLPAGSGAAATRHVFEDPMNPGMGNKKAFEEHMRQNPNRPGAWIQMDGNDFKKINDKFGHAGGDSAIKAFGSAAREAMDETVGSENGKLFRNGGDEFVAHVPSHEHAAQFHRALSEKLHALAPMGGSHKLSMAFGFGPDPHTADKALYEAKKQKIEAPSALRQVGQKIGVVGDKRKYKVGAVPNVAHSLMPGHEGPLPVHDAGMHAIHSTVTPPSPAVVKPVPAPKTTSPSQSQPQKAA